MRYQVWAAQMRTLSVEVEAATATEAERLVRAKLAHSYLDWLTGGTEISAVEISQAAAQSAAAAQPVRELLSPKLAAERLGISRSTLYELWNSGDLGSVRIGRRRFVARAQIDAYIQERVTESGED